MSSWRRRGNCPVPPACSAKLAGLEADADLDAEAEAVVASGEHR